MMNLDLHILLIEDNNDILSFYETIITEYIKANLKCSLVIYKARDYGDYLQVLEARQSFDFVISDWVLLNKSIARDIIIDLYDKKRTSNNNIMIITGYTPDAIMLKLVEDSIVKGIIRKPPSCDAVKEIVKEFVKNDVN